MFLIGLKFVCWVITIWYTQAIVGKFIRGYEISRKMFVIQAAAITGLMLLYNIL